MTFRAHQFNGAFLLLPIRMRIKQTRHHLRVSQDRADRYDIHPPLQERRCEVVPAEVEVEGDSGLLYHLDDGPAE